MIRVEEILKLDIFKNIELVAGKKGLNRMITWVYPIHTEKIEEWIKGGEMLLISKYHLSIDNQALYRLLEVAIKYNLSAIVVEGGISIVSIDQKTIDLADKYNFPLFWANSEVRFMDITKPISSMIIQSDSLLYKTGVFLENIFMKGINSEEEIIELAEIGGVKLKEKNMVAIFSAEEGENSFYEIKTILASMQRSIITSFADKSISPTSYVSGNSLIFLISESGDEMIEKRISQFIKIYRFLEALYDDEKIWLSFGNVYDNLSEIKNSFEDALKAMKLLKMGLCKENFVRYSDIGSYKLILGISEHKSLINFRDSMLKKLYDYDKKSNADLFLTLRTYVENRENIPKTSNELMIHRNTLLYRLDKIKSITGAELENTAIMQDYLNAFMILNLYPFE